MRAILIALIMLVIGAAAFANAAAPALTPGVSAKKTVKYHVRMRTKVVIPTAGTRCEQVRVWHALPTTRPWSRVDRIPGVTALSYLPKTGKLEPEKDKVSAHVYFEDNSKFKQGQVCYYQSEFQFYSADRDFDPGSRAISWTRYTNKDFLGAEKTSAINPEAAALADSFKAGRTPYEFVREASVWIRENIKYDAGVGYGVEDVASIMRYKRGHCGHQQTVFKQLCARAGVPVKPVLGLDLDSPNGVSDLSDVRKDFANNHTWSQVCFPETGWVEVDPGSGADCYSIPARFVQNNTAFENYAVWVTETGKAPRMPVWTSAENGKFVCDYGVENSITFTKSN